jgi:hypothetical protein
MEVTATTRTTRVAPAVTPPGMPMILVLVC